MFEIREDIKIECLSMQQFLEVETSNDPNELYERISTLNVYLARSGKLLAEVKLVQDQATNYYFQECASQLSVLSASMQKRYIESKTADINYYVNWLDRINRGIVHSGDNIRTQMSFLKEELRLTKNGY